MRRRLFLSIAAPILALAMLAAISPGDTVPNDSTIPIELLTPNKRTTDATGLPDQDNHDPSNIIRHDGLYYCWFTEHIPDKPYDGFINARIRVMTSPDGIAWTDRGVALAAGENTPWDALGALTAYVVPHDGRFYMFYSAVPEGFRGPRVPGKSISIAVAIADDPMGPWQRHLDGPVFEASEDGWDSKHVDDANILYRDGRWWLYYKGFSLAESRPTRIGLASSPNLLGPYERYVDQPLLKGHAFAAWKHRDGVALVGGGHAEPVVYWAADGVHFTPAGPFKNRSTGFYCPANFTDGPNNQGVTWGFDVTLQNKRRRLFRFECDLAVPAP